MSSIKLPPKIINEDGSPTLEFILVWDQMTQGAGDGDVNLGQLLSGIRAAQAGVDGIIAGTTTITDVLLADRGSLIAELDVTTSNVGTVATSAGAGGALACSGDRASLFKSVTGGASGTTSTVTVTASGGTFPYTYAWTKVSGADVTINSPTAAATSFSGAPGVDANLAGIYKCTVTDDVSATTSVNISVNISDQTTI